MCKASSFGILTELHLFPPPLLICPSRLQMFYCIRPTVHSGQCSPALSSGFQSSTSTVSHTSGEGCKGSGECRAPGVNCSLSLFCGVRGPLRLLEVRENSEHCKTARSVFVFVSFYRKKKSGDLFGFSSVLLSKCCRTSAFLK